MGGLAGLASEWETGSPEEQQLPLSVGRTHFPSKQQPREMLRGQ